MILSRLNQIKFTLASVLLLLLMSACTTVHDSYRGPTDAIGIKTRSGHISKELVITFPAWVSESEKLSALEASAKIKASSKCQNSPYILTEVRSDPHVFIAGSGGGINIVSANIKCNSPASTFAVSESISISENTRLTIEVENERKKRQELEAQLAASVKPSPPQTNAPRRTAHALVIGNGAYPGSGRLDNPVNDANAISQKLRSMGFTVTTVTDANRQRLVQSMAQFRRTAASADISLLYYAGHGVQIFGTNYILPTDVDQTDPAQATIQGVSLNSVVENFLPGKTKLVFLDACRDNALQRTNDRSVSKGLAPISAAEGTLISYATKDGQTAADGVGSKNSPFTQALLEHLNDPQDIAVVLRKVRERVMKITGGKQQPWEYGSLTGGALVLSAIKPK